MTLPAMPEDMQKEPEYLSYVVADSKDLMKKLLAFTKKCFIAIKHLNMDENKRSDYLLPIDYPHYEKRYHEVRYMRSRGGFDSSTPWSPSLRSS
jgi:hypothetical protein